MNAQRRRITRNDARTELRYDPLIVSKIVRVKGCYEVAVVSYVSDQYVQRSDLATSQHRKNTNRTVALCVKMLRDMRAFHTVAVNSRVVFTIRLHK